MYYTDKPNVFPQQKLEIPYNILFILKSSIFTLYKDNISTFLWFNCQINFKSIKIPYNILFMLKTSIYTLFKVNIEFFISSNCQKKNNSNELSFLWLNPIHTFCDTNLQTIHYHFFLLKVSQNIQAIPESSFASGFSINKTFHFVSPSTSIIEYSESAYKS